MTCIIGLVDNGKVYIGGDSAGVAGLSLSLRADEKVFIKDDFIMGFTTSFRMGQLLRYKLKVPSPIENIDTFEYMATSFIDAVRETLSNGGFASKKDEQETGGTFLVGYRGRLFCIESNYQVAEQRLPFAAVGCGDNIAKGAMYVNTKLHPKERISQALRAAEQFSAGVRRPFIIKEL